MGTKTFALVSRSARAEASRYSSPSASEWTKKIKTYVREGKKKNRIIRKNVQRIAARQR